MSLSCDSCGDAMFIDESLFIDGWIANHPSWSELQNPFQSACFKCLKFRYFNGDEEE